MRCFSEEHELINQLITLHQIGGSELLELHIDDAEAQLFPRRAPQSAILW